MGNQYESADLTKHFDLRTFSGENSCGTVFAVSSQKTFFKKKTNIFGLYA